MLGRNICFVCSVYLAMYNFWYTWFIVWPLFPFCVPFYMFVLFSKNKYILRRVIPHFLLDVKEEGHINNLPDRSITFWHDGQGSRLARSGFATPNTVNIIQGDQLEIIRKTLDKRSPLVPQHKSTLTLTSQSDWMKETLLGNYWAKSSQPISKLGSRVLGPDYIRLQTSKGCGVGR